MLSNNDIEALKQLIAMTLQPNRLDIAAAVVELTGKLDAMLKELAPKEEAEEV